MRQIESSNLSDIIAEYISDKIIKMEFKPGDKIVETKIAKKLNVSHSPIREALRILERNRLVELIPRKGAYVTEIAPSHIESLFEILCELLVLVGKKCIKKDAPATLKRINKASKAAVRAEKNNDNDSLYNSIIEFGIACLEGCDDALLKQIIYELLPSLRRILYLSISYRDEKMTQHIDLLINGTKAINDKDANKAEKILRKWITIEKEFCLSFLISLNNQVNPT